VYDHWFVDEKAARESDDHELSYVISDEEFKAQSLKLLKLVRSALIHLSLAAHVRESKSRKEIDDRLIAEMELFEVEDSFRL